MRVGFLGLGTMGTPMALNLSRKFPLTVWNRSSTKYADLKRAGATIAERPSQVVEQSDVVFSMLFDGFAIQSILNNELKKALRGKTWINTSSVTVEFSEYLAGYVHNAGGYFIEMPVSGSKVPAEQGQLVGMMAGVQSVAERMKSVVDPITAAAIYCGPIGSGLKTKYAVNLYLVTMTAGLAESMNLARTQGLDLEAFEKVLDAGPLASAYSRIKVAKMLDQNWSVQAGIRDCYNSTQLIQSAAQSVNARIPLANVACSLYREAKDAGLGDEDMIAIVKLLS